MGTPPPALLPSQINLDLRLEVTGKWTNGGGDITAISLANPTHVSSPGHGLITGQTITIAGSNSTPSINGARVVTVLDASTFTVPVNVTVAGTTGTWTQGSGVITANTAASPTVVTSPAHGLITGQPVVLYQTNSTPVLDGSRTVTVIDADHFSVPVAVAVAGTTGKWYAGNNTSVFTCPCPFFGTHVVRLATGTIRQLTRISDTVYTAPGNFSGGPSILGTVAPALFTLSEVVARDPSDRPEIGLGVIIQQITLSHLRAGGFNLEVAHVNADLWPPVITSYDPDLQEDIDTVYGRYRQTVGMLSERTLIHISSITWKPFQIAGLEYATEVAEGVR